MNGTSAERNGVLVKLKKSSNQFELLKRRLGYFVPRNYGADLIIPQPMMQMKSTRSLAYIQNIIYGYVLTDEQPYFVVSVRSCRTSKCYSQALPSLTHVCKQLRREVLPMFFGCHTFHFDIGPHRFGMCKDYITRRLKVFAPHIHLIQRLTIDNKLSLECFSGDQHARIDFNDYGELFAKLYGEGFEWQVLRPSIDKLDTFRAMGAFVEDFSRKNGKEATWLLMRNYGFCNVLHYPQFLRRRRS